MSSLCWYFSTNGKYIDVFFCHMVVKRFLDICRGETLELVAGRSGRTPTAVSPVTESNRWEIKLHNSNIKTSKTT